MELDKRTQELIAIGASITANCQPCLQYHVGKALEHGVDQETIEAAVLIGKMVRKGAASKMDLFASNLGQAAQNSTAASDVGCGCSSQKGERRPGRA